MSTAQRCETSWIFSLCVISASILAAQPASPDVANPFTGNREAIETGAKLFAQRCDACHGSGRVNAPSFGSDPLKHGDTDGEVFTTIRKGVRGAQMPPFATLSDEETWQLVSYIKSQYESLDSADEVPSGDAAAGRELFYGKGTCSTCHEVNGLGGVVGPDLSAAGLLRAEALRQKILQPNDTDRPEGERQLQKPLLTVTVRTRDGREIRGLRNNHDTRSIQITDIGGRFYLFEKDRLASIQVEDKSFMPDDFGKRLSPSGIEDLVAYLKTLKRRDLEKTRSAPVSGGLSFERVRNAAAEPQNWLTYWGDYKGTHYSSLKQITPTNVGQLQAAWAVQMPGESILESTPLVVDGIMYTSGPPGQVFALDARSGLQIWKYQRAQRFETADDDRYNRGVALLGNRLFLTTLDAFVVALDARTGRPLWETQVADAREGYSITSPVLALKDKIVVGVAGGEYGIRGFVAALDASTGQRLWKFNTVPGPGEFGNETWKDDSWKHGSAATWLTGTYDPDLDLIFWPVGNPGPDLDGSVRQGDNLFSCSVVALDAATGTRKWHHQFTPGDTHDWDSTEDLILVDRLFKGRLQKLLLHADRNGMFYILDRTTGKLLSATPFVKQTWNAGFDKNGRPKVVPGSESRREGSIQVFPGSGGATNVQSPSYSPQTGWMYVVYQDYGDQFYSKPSNYEPGKLYWNGWTEGVDAPYTAGVRALDPETGKVVWDYKLVETLASNGVLATGGGVLFVAGADGFLIALDARSGKSLWRFQTGGKITASPMSYAVDGKQYVAISAANVLYAFALP